jgi:hypothetical protein
MTTDLVQPRGRVLCWLFLGLIALAGCGDPEEQWLDDSSGFVYGFSKDDTTREIRFYDVIERNDRVVWSGSSRAGIHLDSANQVFYLIETKREAGDAKLACRLSSYDVKSTRLVRSTRWMTWDGNDDKECCLFLTKPPNRSSHFLVWDFGSERGRNAILNADTESLIDFPDDFLEVVPDGSGFLARKLSVLNTWQDSLEKKKKLDPTAIQSLCRECLWFVDLNGTRQRMTWDDSALRRAVAL